MVTPFSIRMSIILIGSLYSSVDLIQQLMAALKEVENHIPDSRRKREKVKLTIHFLSKLGFRLSYDILKLFFILYV